MNDGNCGWVFWKIEERLKWSSVYRSYVGEDCGWVFWKIEERLKWSGVCRRYVGEDYGRGYETLC